MSVPRTLSLSGLLVTLACTVAACGNGGDAPSAQAPASSQPAATQPASTQPAATQPAATSSKPTLSAADKLTIKLTKNDPPACNFFTPADIKAHLLSDVSVESGIPTQCTYASSTTNATQNIGFIYISAGLIKSTIAKSSKKDQTVSGAWAIQKNQAKKTPGYINVPNLKDSAYATDNPGHLSLFWFVKDHAYYLNYNYAAGDAKQKKDVTLKKLIAFAKTAPAPSSVSKKLTAATKPDGVSAQ